MTTATVECPSCHALHRDIPDYVRLIRCLICGAPLHHPESLLTGDKTVRYSDDNEAVSAGKGVEVTEPFDEIEALMDIEIDRRKGMPRKTKAEEIDELVDDLDELDEEDLDVDVEDVEEVEEDEDPDAAPKRKRTRTRTKKEKVERTGIGTADVAEAAGIESRQLRMFLRAKGIQPRDDREGRYTWPSLNDPEVKMILREIAKGEAKKANDERLADLKEKRAAKKTTAKKTTTRRRRKTSDDEEE